MINFTSLLTKLPGKVSHIEWFNDGTVALLSNLKISSEPFCNFEIISLHFGGARYFWKSYQDVEWIQQQQDVQLTNVAFFNYTQINISSRIDDCIVKATGITGVFMSPFISFSWNFPSTQSTTVCSSTSSLTENLFIGLYLWNKDRAYMFYGTD